MRHLLEGPKWSVSVRQGSVGKNALALQPAAPRDDIPYSECIHNLACTGLSGGWVWLRKSPPSSGFNIRASIFFSSTDYEHRFSDRPWMALLAFFDLPGIMMTTVVNGCLFWAVTSVAFMDGCGARELASITCLGFLEGL